MSPADPETLIRLYAGKGEYRQNNSGEWNQKEWFEHTGVIGIYINPNKIDDKEWKRIVKNKKILYKSE